MTPAGTPHAGLTATLTDTGFLPCCQAVMLDQGAGQLTSNCSVRPANDTEHPSYFSALAARDMLLFPSSLGTVGKSRDHRGEREMF